MATTVHQKVSLGAHVKFKGGTPFVDVAKIEFTPPGTGNSVSNPQGLDKGVPSLFNPYAVVVFPTLNESYNSLIDGAYKENGVNFTPSFEHGNPSISQLVNDPNLQKKTPYSYTDFLYCKYVGEITNNHLITLRRYPAPTFDNLAVPARKKDSNNQTSGNANVAASGNSSSDVEQQEEFYPMAQAVTWLGEATGNKLSELMSFTVGMNWKLFESEVNTVSGNEQGSEDTPAPGVAKLLGVLTGQVNTPFATQNSQYDPYNGGPYAHRVYGPVNVINKAYKRDRGLEHKHSMTVNFEYQLKSIGNINPKAAMLDLMSNLLALTYNNAAFWGGANRYFPQKPTYPFLGGKDGMNAWYRGDPVGFAKSVGKQFSSASTGIMDILGKLAENPIETLKGIAAGAAKLGAVEMGKGRAPNILVIKALLTGEPIGEWHMVVGNPYKPIAMIGNLICTEAKFQFNDTLGADDFPTELKMTVSLEHGRPRDAGDLQSMFNNGQGRIYYPYSSDLANSLNNSASTRNSSNDTSWKSGNNDMGNLAKNTQKVNVFDASGSNIDDIMGSVKRAAGEAGETGKAALKTADLMLMKYAGSNTNSNK